jgi:hypothetical protein
VGICARGARRLNRRRGVRLPSALPFASSAGNMRVDVRSRDHHGDLVIATALWSAVGRPPGRVDVGTLEGWY